MGKLSYKSTKNCILFSFRVYRYILYVCVHWALPRSTCILLPMQVWGVFQNKAGTKSLNVRCVGVSGIAKVLMSIHKNTFFFHQLWETTWKILLFHLAVIHLMIVLRHTKYQKSTGNIICCWQDCRESTQIAVSRGVLLPINRYGIPNCYPRLIKK